MLRVVSMDISVFVLSCLIVERVLVNDVMRNGIIVLLLILPIPKFRRRSTYLVLGSLREIRVHWMFLEGAFI